MVATITELSICAEEVAVYVESEFFSYIICKDPHRKILYLIYAIAACNPLYPNVVKLECGIFLHVRLKTELLKRFALTVKELSVERNSKIQKEKEVMKILLPGTSSFSRKFFLQMK